MICPKCKAWSHPAEFDCYNCGESFCPGNGYLGVILIIIVAAILGIIYGH